MSRDHRSRPVPPRPQLVRQPQEPFGWLEARLLHQGWLAEIGPHAVAAVVLLMLAADRHGASYYGRERMAQSTGMTRSELDRALDELLADRLVEFRPWRPGAVNGVWQLMPVPEREDSLRANRTLSVADVLGQLGLAPP